jgi:hypothetical protein
MNRFVLYEQVEGDKAKLIAEGVKFSRNGKVACSFHLPVPSIFIFDNIDQFVSLYCNEKIKMHMIPEKEAEKKSESE